MADPCAADSRDLLANRLVTMLAWRLPEAGFLIGCFVAPPWRTPLWTVSLAVAGIACFVNAARCGRLHCYFTGPLFLLGSLASLTYGVGVLQLGPAGWRWIAVVVVLGAIVLRFAPERVWGKYRASSAGRLRS